MIRTNCDFELSPDLTALVLNDDGSGCGGRSAGSSIVVRHHSELVLISLGQVLYLESGGVHISPVTPEGRREENIRPTSTKQNLETVV